MDSVFLSRLQFAFTALFHILWPVHIIGVGIFLTIIEVAWIRTGNDQYYRHLRFWNRLFLLNLAVGVATGLVMEFQFGTNWSLFSVQGGDVFGHLLGFEAAMAFMLEASFVGIMLAGWRYVGRWPHALSTAMVAFGGTLSAFWIMVANSWMQTPAGGHFEGGRFKVVSNLEAIFNPNWFWGVSHMWTACIVISTFSIGGISAWYLLKGKHVGLFLKSFKIAVIAAVFFTPLQVYLGDGSGRSVYKHQPTKLAAMEMHWQTNPSGEGAPWHVVAWPDTANQTNTFEINIPDGLSLITTRSLTGTIMGLREFRKNLRPPLLLPFYCFRVMIALGFAFVLLALWSLWSWYRGQFTEQHISENRKLLFAWTAALPLGYLAMEVGWVVREVGRQPWVIYGYVKTQEAASPIAGEGVAASLTVLAVTYGILTVAFFSFAVLLIRKGPGFIGSAERQTKVGTS